MKPNVGWLVLNYQCNNRCVFCYAEATEYTPKRDMPLDYAKEILHSMAKNKMKSCILIGGEPTLYRQLEEVIAYGTSLGLNMRIVTNGRKFSSNDFLKKLIKAGLKSASISFEASNEALFQKITGVPNAWIDTLQGIKNCLEIQFTINSLTTLNTLNKNDLVGVATFLHGTGVRKIMYNFATPNCTPINIDTKFVVKPDEAAKLIEKAYTELKNLNIKIFFLPTLPICLFSEKTRNEIFSLEKMGCACHIYTGAGVVFDSKGYLLPCTHLTEVPTDKVMNEKGHFSHVDNFKSYWNDSNFAPLQLRRKMWKFPTENCEGCAYWGKCVGGCPLFRTVYDPKTYIPGLTEGGDKHE